jgi:hypothetical protein
MKKNEIYLCPVMFANRICKYFLRFTAHTNTNYKIRQ